MGQELIQQPQLFESHVSFLSSDSLDAKYIYVKNSIRAGSQVIANQLSAVSVSSGTFSSGTTAVSATFQGVYYGWGWELQGVDKGQPGVNTWVRSNSSTAIGYTTLSSKNVYGDFLGTTRFRTISSNVITTNTVLGSSTFHGVYYGDGRNLLGVSFDQPEINSWVRSNSATDYLGNIWLEISTGDIALNDTEWGKTVYGNGSFVSINYTTDSDNIAVSVDGKSWSTFTSPVTALTDIVYGNGLFIVVSDFNALDINRQVAISTDGVTWSDRACHSANWQSIAYGKGIFIAVSNDGYVFWTKDGNTWTGLGLPLLPWKKVCFGNNEFKVIGCDLNGTDIETYIAKVSLPTTPFGTPNVEAINILVTWWYNNNIIYGNGVYILTTDEDTTQYYTSLDGVNWILRTFPITGTKKRYAYGDGLFVLTINKPTTGTKFYVSKDGVTWIEKFETTTADTTINSVDYGNGIFVASSKSKVFVSGRVRSSNEPNVNIRHGNGVHFGNQYISGKFAVNDLSSNSSSVSFVVENGGELQKRFLDLSIVPQYTFTKDLSVSLATGKSFGRYINGNVIASTGKTVPEVLEMSLIEPITPDATLNSTTTIAFNQTAISNVLTFTHKISSLGATADTAALEWRRNGTGSWTVLSTSTASLGTYTHTMTDTAFNSQTFNYRYTITDTAGATKTVTKDITPSNYQQPTITLSVSGAIATPETNAIRERGNVISNISGTITRQSPNVALQSYQIQYQVNGTGSWSNVGTSVSVTNGATAPIVSVLHTPTADAGANTLTYRVLVTDAYNTTTATSTSIVTLGYFIFFGPSATAPTNSLAVRSLPNRQFATTYSNPFTFSTGTTLTKFTVALPTALVAHDTVTVWTDDDSLSAPVPSTNTPFLVNDAAGNGSIYNVYTASASVPYTPTAHTYRVTRG